MQDALKAVRNQTGGANSGEQPQPIRRNPLEYWFHRLTYHSAANETDFAAFSSSVRTTRAGAPTISELGGNSLPSVTSAPAPTMQLLPILAPLSRIAPIPI